MTSPCFFLTDSFPQEFCYKIDFPRGLLVRWFIALYVNDVVEEEVTLKNPCHISFQFHNDGDDSNDYNVAIDGDDIDNGPVVIHLIYT